MTEGKQIEIHFISSMIFELRGKKIILDYDLALLYGIETKRLKESVRRNILRFPDDFMFELTKEEYQFLRSQNATLETGRGKYSKYLPFAFTEQGVAMVSSIVNSNAAIQMSIQIMRTFVFIRRYALSNEELLKKVEELELKYNENFKNVFEAISFLLKKESEESTQKERKSIGFKPDMAE
jgi:hypothetical protein